MRTPLQSAASRQTFGRTAKIFASGAFLLCVALLPTRVAAQGSDGGAAEVDDRPPRCRIIPAADKSLQILVDGQLRAAWHFPTDVPRPFLYPLNGPSGESVTRMGHPGAPDHDHHRSVWFAHFKVDGYDFWSENGETQIEQQQWYALEDGDEAARLAVALRWFAPDQTPLVDQDVIMELRPLGKGETALEIQTRLRPAAGRELTVLQKTNFGLLACRLSKTISQVFGRGQLTADNGDQGEPALFAKPHRWVDYSGASPLYEDGQARWFREGLTYFDHPSNPGFPNTWHVRQDGWMCASPTMNDDIALTTDAPLTLRYLLYVHAGGYDEGAAQNMFDQFRDSAPLSVIRSEKPHHRYQIVR